MTKTKILRRLVQRAPAIIAECTKPGPHCVLSTAVAQDTLTCFGIDADPYPAEVRVCNDAWSAWAAADFVGGPEEQLRRGAYLLSNDPNFCGEELPSLNPPTGAAWLGHVALRVDDWLLDLDLGAFSRETKHIWLPPAFMAPFIVADGVPVVAAQYTSAAGHVAHVLYRPLVAPYAEDFRTSKDWTQRERFADLVTRIVRAIRKES